MATEYSKPSVMNKNWSSQGVSAQPSDFKWSQGWIQEKPEFEFMNFWMKDKDSWMNYSNQKGLPEYDSETEYVKDKSFIQFNGSIYKAIEDVKAVSPLQDTSGSYWLKIFNGSSTALDASNVSPFMRSFLLSTTLNEVDSFLSISNTGKAVLRSNSQADARTSLGLSSYWSNLVTNSTVSQSQSALGFSEYGKGLINKTNVSTTLDYLGFSAIGKQLASSSSQNNALNTLGGTTTGINLFRSSSADNALSLLSVSSLGIDFLKQTSFQNMKLKIGMTAFSADLSTAANASDHLTKVGVSNYVKTLLSSSNDSAFRTSIGANNASNLNTGTLPAARIASSSITDDKLQRNYVYNSGNKKLHFHNASINQVQLYENDVMLGVLAYKSELPSISSESVYGLVKEANVSQMNNKTSDKVYVKPSVVANGSGYTFTNTASTHTLNITFPSWMGGYSRRGGKVYVGGNGTVTLPSLFPNACLCVSVTNDTSARNDQRPMHGAVTAERGIVIKNPDSDGAWCWWTAEGY